MSAQRPSRRQRQVLLVLRELGTAASERTVARKGAALGYWTSAPRLHVDLYVAVLEGWATREGAPGTYAYTITSEGIAALEAGR